MYVDTHREGKGPAILMTYQDPALGAAGFGQSAAERPAVTKIQRALRSFAAAQGNMDYHPGLDDGRYGLNTHAAIIRVSRDFLEPEGLSSATCRSTCNTLGSPSKAFCKDCLAQMLANMAGAKLPGLSLSPSEINEITDAYGEWLDAYVAQYGERGETDPRQIARREGVSLEEAARLAAERTGTTPGDDTVAVTPVTDEEVTGEEIANGGPAMRASFPWGAMLIIAAIIGGTVGASWYYTKKGEKGVRTPRESIPSRSARRAYRPR